METDGTPVLRDISDGVGWITLNRPQHMNAITVGLARELEAAIREVGAAPAVNVVVIRGAGGNFCAGGDFDEVERLRAEGQEALRRLFTAFRRACDAIAAVEVPVLAAVEGVAMAGGFELIQAADIVLVSEAARIADSHINFGMVPGGGSTQRLPRLVGRQLALGLLLSGDRLTGADATRLGLAYRSFAPAEFDSGVRQFATTLATRQRAAVATIKRLVYSGQRASQAAGLDDEIAAVVEHVSGEVGERGIAAFGAPR
ncbi:MAG TPA: enoyl-CoA hydratase/isomerase family protein [Mycobacterium sp.]|nr:enoyl-CoA hydratase/isomerase family protein [Mycobacterium sp.]